MEVWAYYEGGTGYANTIAKETFIATLAGAFGGISGADGESGTIFEGVNEAINGGAGGLGSNTDTNVPGAYLSYILFDQNYNEIQSGYHEISDAASYAHEKLFLNDITISQAGYLYIYTSMQSKGTQPVYFDDMKVTHTHSPIVSKDDYYPFGLTFNGYSRPAMTAQNFKYNGKEFVSNLGLNLYDYHARQYDPALGKWHAIDPMSHMYYSYSPYNYTLNNPILYVDPDGTVVEFADNTSKKDKRQFKKAQRRLNRKSKTARKQWKQLKRSDNVHTIHVNEKDSKGKTRENETVVNGEIDTKNGNGTDIYVSTSDSKVEGEDTPAEIGIGHEEAHASRFDSGKAPKIDNSNIDYLNDSSGEITNKLNENAEKHRINEEIEASHIENKIRAEYDPRQKKFGLRKTYSNIPKQRMINGSPSVTTYPPVNVVKSGYRYYKKKKKR